MGPKKPFIRRGQDPPRRKALGVGWGEITVLQALVAYDSTTIPHAPHMTVSDILLISRKMQPPACCLYDRKCLALTVLVSGPFLCLHLLLGTPYLHTFILSTPSALSNAT